MDCRFIVRDFTYDEEAIERQRRDLEGLVVEEKELWVRSLISPTLTLVLEAEHTADSPCRSTPARRPTSCACRASTSPSCSRSSSTSRSCARTSRACCGTVFPPPTLPPSSRCVA